MFGVVLKLRLLRLCSVIYITIILSCCFENYRTPYLLETLIICIVCWLFCLDKLTSHMFGHKRGTYHTMRLIVVYCACALLVKMQAMDHCSVANVEMLAFLNFKSIFMCFSREIHLFKKLISLILHGVHQMIGALKFILYIGYLTLNVVILLFVLEIIITRVSLSLQNGILQKRNFITYPEPEGIYSRRALSDNISLTYTDNLFEIKPCCKAGIPREEHVRYAGEDVQIYCEFSVFKNITKLDTYWIKDREVVISNNNDRIEEKTDIEVVEDMLKIKMRLLIRFLRTGEFGLYECVLGYRDIEPEIHAVPAYGFKLLRYTEIASTCICYFGKHLVLRAADVVEHIEIPAGNIAHLQNFFYVTQTPIEEISYEYRINGRDIHHICQPGYGSCTLSVYLFQLFNCGRIYNDWLLLLSPFQCENLVASFSDLYMCVCGSFYGEHSLKMHIPYFNSTTKREEIVEILHEKKLIIEPVAVWWRFNSTQSEKILLEPNMESNKIKEAITELIRLGQERDLYITNLIIHIVAISILLVLAQLFAYAWKLYCRLTIIPARNLIFYGYIFNLTKRLNTRSDNLAEIDDPVAKQYDIFLSYSTEDYHWTKQELLPFMEEECGYKVCFPDRDLAHESGKSKLVLYSSAIQACTKFIVVLSQSYIDDPECNKLQLSTCILPLINGDNGNTRDLIFIKRTCGINMPIQLKWNMDVHIVDWTENNSEKDRRLQLKRFLTS